MIEITRTREPRGGAEPELGGRLVGSMSKWEKKKKKNIALTSKEMVYSGVKYE